MDRHVRVAPGVRPVHIISETELELHRIAMWGGAHDTRVWGRSSLIAEGHSAEVEIIMQAGAWLLFGRAAHTALPIP